MLLPMAAQVSESGAQEQALALAESVQVVQGSVLAVEGLFPQTISGRLEQVMFPWY